MTEQEVINGLKRLFSEHELDLPSTDSLSILNEAVKDLEELQRYHETGHTPSMIKSLVRGEMEAHKIAIEHAIRLDEYTAIGTPEECRNSVLKITEAYNKAIDDFAHELKEAFNEDFPSNYNCNHQYFTLEDVRILVNSIAEQMKGSGANE